MSGKKLTIIFHSTVEFFAQEEFLSPQKHLKFFSFELSTIASYSYSYSERDILKFALKIPN